jgi:hypothetical protein
MNKLGREFQALVSAIFHFVHLGRVYRINVPGRKLMCYIFSADRKFSLLDPTKFRGYFHKIPAPKL